MNSQLRSIEDILIDRLKITQEIAKANTEQLRLNQISGGLMFLDLKDERDGVENSEHSDEQAQTDKALDENLDRINRLEKQLSELDEELEARVEKDS